MRRRTAGRGAEGARDHGHETHLDGAPGVWQIDVRERRLRAAVVGGRADVAGRAVGARLQVAQQVVMGERQRDERDDERRKDEPEDGPLSRPAMHHT